MNILYIPLEFPKYFSAKKMTYPVGVGLAEGFVGKVDFTVVPSFYNSGLWLEYLHQITMGQEYNQVWFEVVHSKIHLEILNYIKSLAEVRVGFVIESLTIHPDEYVNNPEGTKQREENLKEKLPYMTHAVVTDERDLAYFKIPAMLGIASVPESVIDPNVNVNSSRTDKVMFYGTPYGERSSWVEKLGDRISINPQGNLEEQTGLGQKYQLIVDDAFNNMRGKEAIPVGYYKTFCDNWMTTRKQMYANWMNILWGIESYGVLNLPHRTNVLSSRVVESMAAGKVVFSPRMYNGVDFLFNNGENILYYESIEELLDLMDSIDQVDKHMIAQNAVNTVLESFTTEKLVQRVLKFVRENK
jgi:hypothetical protein